MVTVKFTGAGIYLPVLVLTGAVVFNGNCHVHWCLWSPVLVLTRAVVSNGTFMFTGAGVCQWCLHVILCSPVMRCSLLVLSSLLVCALVLVCTGDALLTGDVFDTWCNGKHVCFPSLPPVLECGFMSWLGLEFSSFGKWYFLKLVIRDFLQVFQFPLLLHWLMVSASKIELK